MKISKSLISALILVTSLCAFTTLAVAKEEISVVLNGNKLSFDVPPQMVDGRVMVPMRKIFEELGATVDWDNDTKTVTGKKDDIVIVMTLDNPVITVRGEEIILDVPPQIVEGRTLVPARAVAEGLKADVKWNGETQTVIIVKEENKSSDNEQPVNTKRVGEDKYGYITIPSDWIYFIDIAMVQANRKSVAFCNLNGSIIINIDYYGLTELTPEEVAKGMAERIENQGATKVVVKETKINDMVAYQISSYYGYDNTNLFAWFFYDKNNEMHYISVEGPVNEVAEGVAIVEETYSLEK